MFILCCNVTLMLSSELHVMLTKVYKQETVSVCVYQFRNEAVNSIMVASLDLSGLPCQNLCSYVII